MRVYRLNSGVSRLSSGCFAFMVFLQFLTASSPPNQTLLRHDYLTRGGRPLFPLAQANSLSCFALTDERAGLTPRTKSGTALR